MQNWADIAPDIAIEVLGQPTKKSDTEWRWGNNYSMCLNIEAGTFYNFEDSEGGGVTWLLQKYNIDSKILEKFTGLAPSSITPLNNDAAVHDSPISTGARPLEDQKMMQWYNDAIVKLQYNDNFWVMRFPENHALKQKYVPFSQHNGQWFMRRPEGKLPIYAEQQHLDKPILINEGEKACLGAAAVYDYDCGCWHGGAKAWEKSDWSPIYGREVYIWPDNDEVGKTAAWQLAQHLKDNECRVLTAIPPKDFADKDDLWDAKENSYFADSFALETFIKGNQMLPPKGDIYFQPIDEVMAEVKEPNWLIKDMFERESVMSIFGAAKSGKTFVAIAMACAVATGEDFYGYPSKQATTLYLCGEGKRGVGRRVKAYEQHFNKNLSNAPLLLSNRGARITEEEEFEKLLQNCNAIEKQYGEIGFIIFDTFQRNFSGNENSSEDVGLFIQRLDKLVAEFGTTCCFVHHTGHGTSARARGSSVIQASLDYEFKIESDKAGGEMWLDYEQTLNKDGQNLDKMQFLFQEVELLGFENLTSGVLLHEEKPQASENPQKQQECLDEMIEYAIEKDSNNPQEVWFGPSALSKFTGKTEGSTKAMLGTLKKNGLVNYDEKARKYKSKKWDLDC